MVPSQCRVMLNLCDASEILKDRVEFWNDIYGTSSYQPISESCCVLKNLQVSIYR